jgi:WD40 repeat protein
VFFEPDGKHFLAASYREIQRFGESASEEPEKTLLSTDTSHGRLAAFTRDGDTLAVYRGLKKDDGVILWDVRARRQLVRIEARITDQRFVLAGDASWLATIDSGEQPRAVHVWDGKSGKRRFTKTSEMRPAAPAASPDVKTMALGLVDLSRRDNNKILLLDAQTGRELAGLPTRASPLTAITFSADGRFLAAGITGEVQVWDVDKRQLVHTIRGFERVVMTLAYSPDAAYLAAGTQDGQVWIWHATGEQTGQVAQIIQAGTSGVRLLIFSPDGRSLVTGGIKRHPLMIWDVLPANPSTTPSTTAPAATRSGA